MAGPYKSDAVRAIRTLLKYIGEDIEREGLKETPHRFLKAWDEMLYGYCQDPKDVIKTFASMNDEMVVVTECSFTSLCEHHLLPFTGAACVGYLPNGKVIGLSKIPRLVDIFAKRLQIQENLTALIADALFASELKPKGVGVVITATHMCMSCRGVKKQNAKMTTSALRGAFKDDPSTRAEFLSFLRVK